MNFCHQCGSDLQKYTNPKFCIECGTSLIEDHTGPPDFVQEQPESKHDEWADIIEREIDVVQAVSEFMLRTGGATTKIGVLIRMHNSVEASLPWNDKTLENGMNPEDLPFNLTMNPVDQDALLALWRDGAGRLISKAASLVYYWGGKSYSRKWHMSSPLDPEWGGNPRSAAESRLVTVEEDRIDFCIHHKTQMDSDEVRAKLLEALLRLEELLRDGVDTAKTHIAGVGRIKSISLFEIKEEKP